MTERETQLLLDLLDKAGDHTKDPAHRIAYGDAWMAVWQVINNSIRIGQEPCDDQEEAS